MKFLIHESTFRRVPLIYITDQQWYNLKQDVSTLQNRQIVELIFLITWIIAKRDDNEQQFSFLSKIYSMLHGTMMKYQPLKLKCQLLVDSIIQKFDHVYQYNNLLAYIMTMKIAHTALRWMPFGTLWWTWLSEIYVLLKNKFCHNKMIIISKENIEKVYWVVEYLAPLDLWNNASVVSQLVVVVVIWVTEFFVVVTVVVS